MEFPSKVKVGHLTFEIKTPHQHNCRAHGKWGETSFLELVIEIDDSLPARHKANTLIHEIMHAAWRTFEYDAFKKPDDAEETYVSAMSAALAVIWADNPEVFQWVHEALRGD